MKREFLVANLEQTYDLGRRFGVALGQGAVVALEGPMGVGKTQFARGVAVGLSVINASEVSSPTFSYLHVYDGRLPLSHMDWFRVPQVSVLSQKGLLEPLGGEGVTLIEWFSKYQEVWPFDLFTVELAMVPQAKLHRHVLIHARGECPSEVLERLRWP